MRLKSLFVTDFKNLKNFTMTFQDRFTTVLVGPNGTGKSNILEVLTLIFRDLDLGTPSPFAYTLTYTCNGAEIHVDAAELEGRRRSPTITVNGASVPAKKFARRGGGNYLPTFLFGYYSGPSNRMELHFEPHQKQFATDLLNGVDQPLRPLLYARLVHSQFVLLSFFQREGQNRDILSEFLRIEDLESVLFVLKRPNWHTSQRHRGGDPRFWGARGVVRDFLDRLYRLSLAPLRVKSSDKNTDRLYLFVKNKHDLMTLAQEYEEQQEFFKALESLYISDLIEDVRTSVKVRGVEGSLTFRELSEGEQQLLMVLGLLRFLESKEGLILLDEPDTHLNPAWSVQYTKLLKDHVSDQETTQIVMATHDPLVVAGLTAPEVQVMSRDDKGRVSAHHPEVDPKGMGVAALLTSDIYGLRSTLDPDTLADLDRKRDLAIRDNLTEDEKMELRALNESLSKLDFTRTVRDPLYKPFVEAMTQVEQEMGLRDPVLTPDQLEDREAAATEVIRTLRRRNKPKAHERQEDELS